MRFDFSSIRVPASFTAGFSKKITPYAAKLRAAAADTAYHAPESALYAPFDTRALRAITALARAKRALMPERCIVIGIGGMSQGARAVADALFCANGAYQDPAMPELLFVEGVHARTLYRAKTHVQEDVRPPLIIIASKSGSTVETMANASAITAAIMERVPRRWHTYVTVITDPHTRLAAWAAGNRIDVLPLPAAVPGRMSAFTAATLFPLAVAGVDIAAFTDGARKFITQELKKTAHSARRAPATTHAALQSAAALSYHARRGASIHHSFHFSPDLFRLGQWYRQLAAESLGKRGAGPVPCTSVGTEDLHSVAQLFLDGPRNAFTTFLDWKPDAQEVSVMLPDNAPWNVLAAGSGGRPARDISAAALTGTLHAYRGARLPFAQVTLAGRLERELGAYMAWRMMEVMYMGHGRGLGASVFTQDAVELYKKHLRSALAKRKR